MTDEEKAMANYFLQIERNGRDTIDTYRFAVLKDWTREQTQRYIETGEMP